MNSIKDLLNMIATEAMEQPNEEKVMSPDPDDTNVEFAVYTGEQDTKRLRDIASAYDSGANGLNKENAALFISTRDSLLHGAMAIEEMAKRGVHCSHCKKLAALATSKVTCVVCAAIEEQKEQANIIVNAQDLDYELARLRGFEQGVIAMRNNANATQRELEAAQKALANANAEIKARENSSAHLNNFAYTRTAKADTPLNAVDDSTRDAIKHLRDQLMEAQRRSLSCCFCDEKFNSLDGLKTHSLTCKKHPAAIELEKSRRGVDYPQLQEELKATREELMKSQTRVGQLLADLNTLAQTSVPGSPISERSASDKVRRCIHCQKREDEDDAYNSRCPQQLDPVDYQHVFV